MLDYTQALAAASDWARNYNTEHPCSIVEASTREYPFGWVFFYNATKYFETGNFSDRLAGNGPLIVNRFDGSIHPHGSSKPLEYCIERYVAAMRHDAGASNLPGPTGEH